jgi:hypothetical protein
MDAMAHISIDDLQARVAAIEDSVLQSKITKAVALLHRAFALYGYAEPP